MEPLVPSFSFYNGENCSIAGTDSVKIGLPHLALPINTAPYDAIKKQRFAVPSKTSLRRGALKKRRDRPFLRQRETVASVTEDSNHDRLGKAVGVSATKRTLPKSLITLVLSFDPKAKPPMYQCNTESVLAYFHAKTHL